jgi:ferredoxin
MNARTPSHHLDVVVPTVEFTLDGKSVHARADETLWQVARREGTTIPHLCHKDGLTPAGNCRACVVEVEGERTLARHLLNMDPPEHAEFRKAGSHWFTPRAIERRQPEIERITRDLLAEMAGDGSERTGDFVADLAAPLTLHVLADMLGVPRADWRLMFRWTNQIAGASDSEYQTGDAPIRGVEDARHNLFAYFNSSNSKSRENYLRMLRGPQEDFVLNEYSLRYLEEHKLAVSHLAKLRFSSQVLSQGDEEWSQYLERLDITSATAVKLLTEAALLGSAIEGGVSPELVVLSDGAKQFAILVHALCWVHAERGIRRLPGATAQHRQDLAEVTSDLWDYYQELKAYQQQPTAEERERLDRRFDEIFRRRYRQHYGLNLALQQFCTYKQELRRVLDVPQVPLHTNAAESDIREYVTRRKISGGTRHDDGRRVRDTFTGLKKTCRKLGVSFWQYLLSRCLGDKTVSYLPELLRARASPQNDLSLEVGH